MGFEKFGRFGYVSQAKIVPMLSYLEKDQIVGTRCTKCKRVYFPPRVDCLDCRTSKIEWVPLDGACRLVTFTEVHFAPPPFQHGAPYLLGVAEMKNGLRVFAPISSHIGRSDLKPGLPLVLKSVRNSGDGLYYQLENPATGEKHRRKISKIMSK